MFHLKNSKEYYEVDQKGKFVVDIYPIATLSTEHPETPEEPQEKQAVLN